jgi:hypothetical protein
MCSAWGGVEYKKSVVQSLTSQIRGGIVLHKFIADDTMNGPTFFGVSRLGVSFVSSIVVQFLIYTSDAVKSIHTDAFRIGRCINATLKVCYV